MSYKNKQEKALGSIELQTTDVYTRNWDAYEKPLKEVKIIINQAGSRSGKTYAILQCIVVAALSKKINVTIVRISLPFLKRSVVKDMVEILTELGIYDVRRHNKTDQIYLFPNGSTIEFLAADNSMKLKGTKRDILFISEATEISHAAYIQLAMRTKGKIWIDFNPEDIDHWVYDVMKEDDCATIRSTYKDNPFLEESQVKFIEEKISVDPNWYKIYVLGERPSSNLRIYSHFQQYVELPPMDIDDYAYGLDFGYNHPSALVKCMFIGDDVYVKEELYRSNMTINDLIAAMNELGIERNRKIYCDSARPEIIEELRRSGYTRAVSSNKNVKAGIDRVKSKPIYIDKFSPNLWSEFRKYIWKAVGDKILDEPVKLNDDALDAMRYAIHTHLKGGYNDFYANIFTL